MMSQKELTTALLSTINGARLVTVDAYEGDDSLQLVSVWNGAATVNLVGVYLEGETLTVTGLDVWTNYDLPELPIDMVEDKMRATANDRLANEAEEGGFADSFDDDKDNQHKEGR
jgi:hypothetical protein